MTATHAPIVRLDQNHRRSRAVIANGMVFLAGQVADDKSGDIAQQAREALAKVDALLAEAGTDKSKLLMVNIWLSDMSTFAEMNGVWDKWVIAGQTPGRATVEAKLAAPQFTVEIAVIAAK